MKNEVRPIDKSKPSNRRCINCEAWETATGLPVKYCFDRERHCIEADKDINYWNRCPLFRWNPNKVYKEDGENG